MKLRPYQEDVIYRIKSRIHAGIRRLLIVVPTGGGKCLAKGTPILMHSGQIKPVEAIKVGDLLMGPDSKPRKVLSLARGREEMFRVTPIKGDAYTVNRSHVLSLRMTSGGDRSWCAGKSFAPRDIANVTVDEYLASSNTFKHCAKGWRVGVDFPSSKTPEALPPYILGTWLGDGNSRGPSLTNIDDEIISEWNWLAMKLGCQFRREIQKGKCQQFHISNVNDTAGRGRRINPVKAALHNLNLLNNKHIPDCYKINSESVRLEVLAGLIDTDGALGNGIFDYISKVERLADDVCFLARSLGFAAYKTPCKKTCGNNGKVGDYFRVCISGDISRVPCRLQRKRPAKRLQKKNVLNVGIKVESVGEDDYFGFEIDGDRLFLLGDFTVTHNTVMFSNITSGAARKSKSVNLLVHRDTLLTQTSATLTRMGIEHGLIASGYTPSCVPVQVSSIWTLVRRLTKVGAPDIIIMDEAHHAAAGAWLKVIEAWPNAVILGFTATPERLDGKGLGDIFQEIIEGPQVEWLMQEGYLTRARYIGVPPDQQLDLSGLSTTASGDYNADKVAEIADKPHITGCAIKHYLHYCPGQPAVTFVANLAQGRHVKDQFNAAGIASEILDGDVETNDRKRMVADLAAGRIKNIISCEIINEGFDLPVCAVAILLRPTESLALHLQQIGRILRVVYATGFNLETREGRLASIAAGPKPFAFVLDHVGNMKHGRAELRREWSLEGANARRKRERLEEAALANRQCPSCFSITAPAPKCPCCGWVFEVKAREIKQVDGSLSELSNDELDRIYLEEQAKKKARAQVDRAQTREQLEAIAAQRGYKASWVDHMLAAKAKKLSQKSA